MFLIFEQRGFWLACHDGQTEIVRFLFNHSNPFAVNVDIDPTRRRPPLDIATRNGHFDVVKFLISEKRMNVDLRNDRLSTPLILAAEEGREEIVNYLISMKADVSAVKEDNASALWQACWRGYLPIVQVLVKNGAKINQRDQLNRSCIWIASANGRTEIVSFLAENKADLVSIASELSVIGIACNFGHLDVIKCLVANGVAPHWRNRHGISLLMMATDWRKYEIVDYLCQVAPGDMNAIQRGITPPLVACIDDKPELLKIFAKHGANFEVEIKGTIAEQRFFAHINPFYIACGNKTSDCVRILFEHGINLSKVGDEKQCPFKFALISESFETIRYLVSKIGLAFFKPNTVKTHLKRPKTTTSESPFFEWCEKIQERLIACKKSIRLCRLLGRISKSDLRFLVFKLIAIVSVEKR